MKDCGIDFGELPLNNYFWRLIAPMETPMDFVTRLNLTFEQANLDFSKHYAGLFRQVGDTATAGVLEKIYQDEIGHVGHGVKWFRKWKDQQDNDWNAFKKSLVFPFSASKAKGLAPFNAEGRKLAGFDDNFIEHLEVYEQSRGRTPVVHWFNPSCEMEVAARRRGENFHPKKMSAAMEYDAEMVMLAWCRRDDVALMRRIPSKEHLAYLKRVGFQIPEVLEVGKLNDRKLGGLRPWAWSPDASELFQTHRDQVPRSASWKWREAIPDEWLSKEIGVRFQELLDTGDRSRICSDLDSAKECLGSQLSEGPALIKGVYGCAGRDHLRVADGEEAKARDWLTRVLAQHSKVVIEGWRDRVADFSALYEMDAEKVQLMGMTVMENDPHGRFVATRVAPKWGSMFDKEVAAYLFREADVMDWYEERIPAALQKLLPGYVGPLGVDAMVYRKPDGSLDWTPVVELNVRMTMGRVALELMGKSRPGAGGKLTFLRRARLSKNEIADLQSGTLDGGSILLNDPSQARGVPCKLGSLSGAQGAGITVSLTGFPSTSQ